MNKQEAIEIVESRAFNIGDIDLACGLSYTKHIINQIDEPQKVVVPKFVADFYESIKDDFESKVYGLCLQFNRDSVELSSELCELSSQLYEWFDCRKNEPIQTLVEMKLYGYEVEKKKLYTVRIPNPNRTSFPYTLYRKGDGKIIIIGAGDDYEKRKEYQLTESEIKKDFEWAWDAGFTKEVEDK